MANIAIRLTSNKSWSSLLRSQGLLSVVRIQPTQSAGIKSIAMRGGVDERPVKPWPYKEKGYSTIQSYFDYTTKRFDENTKVIVVEGPVAAGKTAFASKVAEDLGFQHFPERTMDHVLINGYGYDLRQLDPQLPLSCKSYDEKSFNEDPGHFNCAKFQMQKYHIRYFQYVDALAHLLNTGQGVVVERSPYSDKVFLETMVKFGYLTKSFQKHYYELVKNTIYELLQPHLIVYLDVPVPEIQNRIKKRNLPSEGNSKALTKEFLEEMEHQYKQIFLKNISAHSEVLIYDWSEYGDPEVVVEDIERIDFDRFEKHDRKLHDWRMKEDEEWCELRHLYTNRQSKLNNYFNVPNYNIPEIVTLAEDETKYWKVRLAAPGEAYFPGYNPAQGDSVLFKL